MIRVSLFLMLILCVYCRSEWGFDSFEGYKEQNHNKHFSHN